MSVLVSCLLQKVINADALTFLDVETALGTLETWYDPDKGL